MNASPALHDRTAAFAALSFACSSWAALGTAPFVESAVGRAMLLWSSPALALGALVLAFAGLRGRPVVAIVALLVAVGAAGMWAASLGAAQA